MLLHIARSWLVENRHGLTSKTSTGVEILPMELKYNILQTGVLKVAAIRFAYVKDDSTIGGPNPIYQKYTNFITIMHANEEYSRYDHLAPRSSKVEVGQTVKRDKR